MNSEATRATEVRGVLHPLLRPWQELPDHAAPRRVEPKKGFWRGVGQFLFDYNRF